MDLAERPVGVESHGSLGKNTRDDLDPVGAQELFSPNCHRIGVGLGDDDAGNPGLAQGMAAWTGASGVIARFQGDDGSGSPGSVASLMQCLYLGV